MDANLIRVYTVHSWTSPLRLVVQIVMIHALRNLADSVQGNAPPLFESERILGGLKLDQRTLANGPSVDHSFEVERFRLARDRIAEPAEVSWLLRT